MAYQYVVTDQFNAIDLGGVDRVFVKSTAALIVSGGPAINGTGDHHTAVIEGAVVGENDGIKLGDSAAVDNAQTVIVSEEGSVRGEDAGVDCLGYNTLIRNAGSISGYNYGVHLDSQAQFASYVINEGDISSSAYGVQIEGFGSTYIRNSGTISGTSAAIKSESVVAFDSVVNRGQIIGNVELGGGSDRYDGRQGLIDGSVYGEGGDDILRGGVEDDFMSGGQGLDTLFGNAGDDVLFGENDNDILRGGDGDDILLGGLGTSDPDGDDTLIGGNGADTMYGGGGSDRYVVNDLGDVVVESNVAGVDTVDTSVSFSLTGLFVEFVNLTGADNISATGNSLANTISGNGGANTIAAKGGADTLTGGAGADTFVFDTGLSAANVDLITDFRTVDTIQLAKSVFSAIAGSGVLTAAQFKANAAGAATDSDDRIVYDINDGRLFYDADGSGAGAKVQFAVLSGAPTISSADFLIV